MGYRKFHFALFVAIVFISLTTSLVGQAHEEQCWEDPINCKMFSGNGFGVESRYCWKRCMCRGYEGGRCEITQKCVAESPGRPLECKCSRKSPQSTGYGKQLRMMICGQL